MVSRSYSNLLDLVSDGGGGGESSPGHGKKLTRIMTMAGIISDLDEEEDGSPKPRRQQQRVIVVGNQLPLRAHRRPDDGKWSFSRDEDSLLFKLRDGLGAGGDGVEVLYVGCLCADLEVVEPAKQEEVSRLLFDAFRCVPAFVPGELHSRFYLGFCKQHLWPLFHYMLPLSRDLGGRFDRSLWQAYVSVNKLFADKVMEVISSSDDGGGDFVWVHDYHLMLLPTFLRRRFNRVRLGFFLHSPFPSSEIYRTLPVRDELLRALLNADLIGFHTFDYARHFLSSCSRVLGLAYESKRGYIGIDYYGRTVNIKILPVGVHMGQLAQAMALPETEARVADLVAGGGRFRGKTVLLGVDDMDIFKGISLKLLAMEQVLEQHPEWRGKLVLVQVANPARGRGRDVQEVQQETYSTVERINRRYGDAPEGYQPIVLIDRPLEFYERVAYYAIAECCLVTAVRDGMNLIPYEYIVSRQGVLLPLSPARPRSMLVLSEFIGCSPSLNGAIRVNPWNVDAVAEAMYAALSMGDAEKQLRHDKNYRYVSTHDAGYWARSFVQDLDRACRDHARRRCWGLGFGLGFRVVALDPTFRKLSLDHIVAAYSRANHRAILLDYDGTMHSSSSSSVCRSPAPETIAILNRLCRDPRNTVYLVGASGKETLSAWFAACDGGLVLAAEHGYFLRQSQGSEWTTTTCTSRSFEWKQIAEPIMELYTEATDGSSIEIKESGVVWHHEHADPDFGSCQAKELLDHLETVLANEPVSVKSSHGIVEVKPQGVTKGLVAEQLLSAMQNKGIRADFVLFVGDDRSDEDMFEVINKAASGPELSPVAEVFACTVGQKPSKAKYYLEDTPEIIRMLQGLADASDLTMAHQPASASRDLHQSSY